jgi:hypothetical protein
MAKASVEHKPESGKRQPDKAAIARPAARNGGYRALPDVFDFFASPTAAQLVSAQGVEPVRRAGDIRPFNDPDPKEAEWFARQVRRWRREDLAQAAKR